MSLAPCAAPIGETILIAPDPLIAVCRDILYVPTGRAKNDAGLFDAGGRLVPAAATFRGAGAPLEPGHNPLDPARFPFAPDDVTYLFVGTLTGHYGHCLLSSFARLWALDRIERRGLKLVLLNHGPIATILAIPWLRALLETLEIGADALVNFPGPVRLREIIVPAPAFVEQDRVHAAFAAMTQRMGERLLEGMGGDTPPGPDRPVFLSRLRLTGGVNRLADEAALCDRLAAHGIAIVHPETLAIADQVRLFTARRAVAGLAGSAFHTTLFAPARRTLALNYAERPLSNQALIDRATGGETVNLYPRDDIVRAPPAPGFDHQYRLRDPRRTADELAAALGV